MICDLGTMHHLWYNCHSVLWGGKSMLSFDEKKMLVYLNAHPETTEANLKRCFGVTAMVRLEALRKAGLVKRIEYEKNEYQEPIRWSWSISNAGIAHLQDDRSQKRSEIKQFVTKSVIVPVIVSILTWLVLQQLVPFVTAKIAAYKDTIQTVPQEQVQTNP